MNNLVKRVLVGIIGIPLILAVSYFGGIYFLIFSLIASSLALWEFCSMFERKGFAPIKYFGMVCSIVLLLSFYLASKSFLTFFLLTVSIISVLEIFRGDNKSPVNPAILLFGIFYITIPFVILNELVKESIFNIVIYIFILIWTCDTTAYFGGRFFGKHQLSPISPKKTREGFVIGFLFTLIISLVIHFIFPDKLTLIDAIILGAIVGIFSQLGDLFESLIKRYCDVKDSSTIIPGHGGMLDRFDSLIFVTPIIFVYLNFNYIK